MRQHRRVLADGSIRYYSYDPKRRAAAEEQPDSLGALIIAYKRSPDYRDLKPRTRQNYGIYVRELEAIADVPVGEIKRGMLMDMRDAIAERRGNGAANAFMRFTATLFSWAVERGKIPYNPVAKVKALKGGHLPAWTAAEADRAGVLLPEELRRAVILARYTGQRRGDLIAMKWDAFDGERILVQQEKAKKGAEERPPLWIPVAPTLRAELLAWKREATSLHMLTNASGQPWQGNYLNQCMDRALPALGLRPELNMHGLRKLAATELAQAGCSTREIAAITGHKTLAMVQLYTESVEQRGLATAAIVKLSDRR